MKPVILTFSAAWERSGLSLRAFNDLLRDLSATGHAVVHRDLVAFSSLRVAELVLGARHRPRRRRP